MDEARKPAASRAEAHTARLYTLLHSYEELTTVRNIKAPTRHKGSTVETCGGDALQAVLCHPLEIPASLSPVSDRPEWVTLGEVEEHVWSTTVLTDGYLTAEMKNPTASVMANSPGPLIIVVSVIAFG
jgi:hypothetical protein